jgi:hypothetical protein
MPHVRSRLPLTIVALCEFVWLDILSLFGFSILRQAVIRTSVAPRIANADVERVREAILDACVAYFKPALCLQRSAAATRMLRRRGVAARLVIGFRPAPIDSHAWVEVDGEIVSDRTPGQEFYHEVDRW